ncbi:DUF2813 domain-containing protein [Parasedimentitalea maritima]|uniref:DUF2813 domain-containing protein n=1 Tax=Parasedimentitalea maritima TaxID=2578117 RepID=A0ABY2UUS9_9RHOB|nr:AAA family ATPase [Zongyanglinia marina]TLP60437.1 DUF2813 domain-containing protein [Zongyanglinia marina]
MHIEQVHIENFRLLKKSTLDLRTSTTLLVGKNNTGKTSFAVLLEKFLTKADFHFDDFSLSVRDSLLSIETGTNVDELSIRLLLKIKYDEKDDISVLSNFMLDLDDTRRHTNVLLECEIDREKLVRDQPESGQKRKKFFENSLKSYLKTKIYAFDDYGYDAESSGAYYLKERNQLQEKMPEELRKLLHFQVIHARRNVASSEESSKGSNPLASISTQFLKKKNNTSDNSNLTETDKEETLNEIEELLRKTDVSLDDEYSAIFGEFLQNAGKFLNLSQLKVMSNLQSQTLIENSSKIVYGDDENTLPENHNGLGYLNILYLLLKIEMVREEFEARQATLNILIIEEPEAHTHPQMQYVFASRIKELIDKLPRLQAVLTTHSSHIVSKSAFEDIRYLSKVTNQKNVEIKNFHTELSEKFADLHGETEGPLLFKFLSQYLSIQSSELFFADKAIFIEGTTERMLLPLFMSKHDRGLAGEMPLSSQNISVLEVGANAKAFAPFLDFLGIKSLIITDIDTTVKNENKKWEASKVENGTRTSNASLTFFFDAPDPLEEAKFSTWIERLKSHKLNVRDTFKNVRVAYQSKEGDYHARSFEDAFIALNLSEIALRKESVQGLKNRSKLDTSETVDFYKLTNEVIDKKSDFASSILFEALANDHSWCVPSYISEGLKWLHQD